MDDDKLNTVLRHKDVHVYDVADDRVRVAVHWDDLNPEPRRSRELDELQSARRALRDEGFDVSDVSREYGRAYVTVSG